MKVFSDDLKNGRFDLQGRIYRLPTAALGFDRTVVTGRLTDFLTGAKPLEVKVSPLLSLFYSLGNEMSLSVTGCYRYEANI